MEAVYQTLLDRLIIGQITIASLARFLPPDYSDGFGAPRLALDRSELPNARRVSALIHRDEGLHDHAATLWMVSWGQLMDHDFTLTATPLGNP